jgi:hypothetical protein
VSEEPKLRCPACGALAAPDAEWCSQCYQPLRSAPPPGRARPFTEGSAAALGLGAPGQPRVPVSAGRDAAVQPVAEVFEAVWDPPTNGHASEASGAAPAAAIPQAPPPPVPVESGPGAVEGTGRRAVWTCPVCGNGNGIELDICATCGTPFTRLFEERVDRPKVDPRTAAKWSLAFPGLGHAKIGRAAEGVARAVLFLWSLGAALLMLLTPSQGLGFIKGLVVIFLLVALAAYALAAMDAFRQAAGDVPILSARLLLYGTAGLVIMSVGSLFVVVIRATHPH